ncbi:PREDICTED: TOX high mobility group box family member 3-like [Branchiostoma belcheri]|uniref:TOX high mobility group box family member 3-like n=1 Tax=Branchiostoma belcheri TaxID=7741 RepID=A0A6P4ZAE1_BRABE|nr:PREDICTED: TOX high mobility group box family member 3-like [Branchiostoma belcheri]
MDIVYHNQHAYSGHVVSCYSQFNQYNFNQGTSNNFVSNRMAEQDSDFSLSTETFHTPSFGDEEFQIPPITPPPACESDLVGASRTYNEPTPQFPPQNLDIPPITLADALHMEEGMNTTSRSFPTTCMGSTTVPDSSGVAMTTRHSPMDLAFDQASSSSQSTFNSDHMGHMTSGSQSAYGNSPLTTISQSTLSEQLGLDQGSAFGVGGAQSPGSKSTSPSGSPNSGDGQDESDDNVPLKFLAQGLKRAAAAATQEPTPAATAPKKRTPKKRRKKDPNEPQKPVSAYALFFRDTQAAIKGQNPNATFGEVSKIVASMWDSLGEEQKQVYKKKTEAAKKEYLKQLAAYRASLVSQAAVDQAESDESKKQNNISLSHSALRNIAPKPNMSPPANPAVVRTSPPRHIMQQSPPHSHPAYTQMAPLQTQMQMSRQQCLRQGCENLAIESPDWDNEYCSNECVVSHCRDVFTAWVASRNQTLSTSVK